MILNWIKNSIVFLHVNYHQLSLSLSLSLPTASSVTNIDVPAPAGRWLAQRTAVMRPCDRETGSGCDVIGRRADELYGVASSQSQRMLNRSSAGHTGDVDHHTGCQSIDQSINQSFITPQGSNYNPAQYKHRLIQYTKTFERIQCAAIKRPLYKKKTSISSKRCNSFVRNLRLLRGKFATGGTSFVQYCTRNLS